MVDLEADLMKRNLRSTSIIKTRSTKKRRSIKSIIQGVVIAKIAVVTEIIIETVREETGKKGVHIINIRITQILNHFHCKESNLHHQDTKKANPVSMTTHSLNRISSSKTRSKVDSLMHVSINKTHLLYSSNATSCRSYQKEEVYVD